MKKVMLVALVALIGSSCTIFSTQKNRDIATHEETKENNWVEKNHHLFDKSHK